MRLQATDEKGFQFTFLIEKANSVDEGDDMFIEGVASTTNVDHDNERMAQKALDSMANIINESSVPLRWEHNQTKNAIIGEVSKAWLDGRNQLWIRAKLDKSHPASPMLHDALKKGSKFGLSVGGRVKNAVRELSESKGQYVKTFYDVLLDEVSVTKSPANYDSWLVRKSIGAQEALENEEGLRKTFLFENQQMDYMIQFAKSIPDGSWKKLEDKGYNYNMTKDTKTVEKTAEEGFVTKSEFSAFAKDMMAGIKTLFKEAAVNAKDTTNPDKDKEEVIGDKAEKGMDSKPKDQDAPNKDKEENIGDGKDAKKSREGQEDLDEKANGSDEKGEREKKSIEDMKDAKEDKKDDKKEKAMGDKDEDKDEDKKEKAMDKDDEDEDKKEKSADDKDEKEEKDGMKKAMADMAKGFSELAKEIRAQKADKKDDEDMDDDKAEKSATSSEIDAFSARVAQIIDGVVNTFAKSGTHVPGLAQSIVDKIRNDSVIQKSISEMLKQPGFKKSVQFGNPYVFTKDGQRLRLTSEDSKETVQKSATVGKDGKPLNFKDSYKANYSAFREETQE